MKAKIILLILLLSTGATAYAQSLLTGKVTIEKGEPAVGANLFVKGSFSGTNTDAEGQFRFTSPAGDSLQLVVSYIGYESQEITLTGTDTDSLWLDIELKPQANELQQVVITAGSFEASDEKKAVMLRPLDIVTTGGSNGNIVAALNTLPGTQSNAEDGRIFVRGGDAHETQTFIDGMRVPNPYTSNVPDLPVRGRFSPFMFKGTSFSTGGYSAAYGDALSSALVLETKDLPEASVTSISLMSIGGGLSHTERWEESALSASVDYTNLGPYVGLVPQNIDWEDPVQAQGAQLGFRQKFQNGGLLKAQANAQWSGFSMRYPKPEDPSERSLLQLDNDNYYGNATYQQLVDEQWRIDAGLAYGQDTEDILQGFELNRKQQMIQGRAVATRYLDNGWNLKMGSEWIRSEFDEWYRSPEGDNFHSVLQEDYLAAFAEGEGYLGENWVVRAGLRSEYYNMLGDMRLSPRLSIARKAGEDAQFSFAYGHFYQRPRNEWLRYTQAVQPEWSEHYLLNYQYRKEGRSLRVEAYYKNYRDLLRFPANEPWLADNSGSGYARGVDVFYRDQESIKYGDFWVSYSFLDTEREYQDFPQAAMPNFAARHNLSVVYKHWIHDLQTSVGVTYTLGSPRPYNDPNTPVFNDQRTPTYQDVSLNASYLTELFGQFTIVHLSVTNVLGFEQSFGQRFSEQPDANGRFTSSAIRPPAPRFFFVGLFVSIGEGQQFGN
ncbi:MAG: TonB-dependent receptor plug domain-containing protein [Bacteroidetes bacterium]|jgi:outer membrane cobalamin receptor|nr:TonB-dependent receptor plug domain-containing protein [Bacteroidota bacterium]